MSQRDRPPFYNWNIPEKILISFDGFGKKNEKYEKLPLKLGFKIVDDISKI